MFVFVSSKYLADGEHIMRPRLPIRIGPNLNNILLLVIFIRAYIHITVCLMFNAAYGYYPKIYLRSLHISQCKEYCAWLGWLGGWGEGGASWGGGRFYSIEMTIRGCVTFYSVPRMHKIYVYRFGKQSWPQIYVPNIFFATKKKKHGFLSSK